MNYGDKLLLEVSQQYQIYRGEQENENEWKARVIYSICGMMAYASLWDDLEESISFIHLKHKISSTLFNYKSLYPEIKKYLPSNSVELEAEIFNQFLNAGVIYHCPHRISPSAKHEELFSDILFQRGIALDHISCVSGIGFYANQNGGINPDEVKAMFGLGKDNLLELWHKTVVNASWIRDVVFENNVEYLRLQPPYRNGYWEKKPETMGGISILRTGEKGSQLYYLYRYIDGIMEVSPLPTWRVEAYQYRVLSCACLSNYGTLPPIEYFEDGSLVHLCLNYLLPPAEMDFLNLYSWPETCTTLPCNFKRKLSKEVFIAIKKILLSEGYELKRGMI